MVHYIRSDNQNASRLLKGYLLAAGISLTSVVGSYYYLHSPSPEKSFPANKAAAWQAHNIDERAHSQDEKPHVYDYNSALALTIDGLAQNPQSANQLVRRSLAVLDSIDAKIEPQTYVAMFDEIKKKAEENPEITDHLGPAAKKYQEKKVIGKYKAKLEGFLAEKKIDLMRIIEENPRLLELYGSLKDRAGELFSQD